MGARPDRARAGLGVAGLRKDGAAHGKRRGRKRHGGAAEETASVRVGVLGHDLTPATSDTIISYAI
jgi:hypothetical protein